MGFLCIDCHHTNAEAETQPDKTLTLQVFTWLWSISCFFSDKQWYTNTKLLNDIQWFLDTSPTHLHLLSSQALSLCSGASNITRWEDIVIVMRLKLMSNSVRKNELWLHICNIYCNIGGRLPDPVERLVGGRSLLASSLLMSPLCHHGALAA